MVNPELIIKISGNSKNFQAELKKLEVAAAASGNKVAQQAIKQQAVLEKNLTDSYKRLAVGLAAVVGGATLAINAFAKYETAVVAVARTTGLAGDELEKLKTGIKGLSEQLALPQTQLLKIAEAAGTLGVTGSANLLKFTETMAKFDIASATLRGEEAATSIARIIQLTGGGIENVDRFGSEIADLADNFNATEAGIVSLASELALINPKFKLSTTNLIGLSTAFSSFGISPEIARTGLSQFSSNLDEALRKGGDKLNLFMALTGMTREELKKTFEETPEKVFLAFSEGLGAAGDKATVILEKLGLNQDRLSGLFLASAQNTDVLTSALQRGNEAYTENTKLNQEAQKALETTESKINQAKVSIENAGIAIGGFLAPAVKLFADETTRAFNNADIGFKALGTIISGLAIIAEESFNVVVMWVQQLDKVIGEAILNGQQNLADFLNKIPGVDIDISADVATRQQGISKLDEQIKERQKRANEFFKEGEDEKNQILADSLATEGEIRDAANEAELEKKLEQNTRKAEIDAAAQAVIDEEAMKKREELLEKQQAQFDEDMEKLQERLDLAVAAKDMALIKEIGNEKRALAEKGKLMGLETDYKKQAQRAQVEAVSARVSAEEDLHQAVVDSAFATLSVIVGDNKAAQTALFLASKAAAVAKILVNGQAAAALALATIPPPAGEAVAASRIAYSKTMAVIAGVTALPELAGKLFRAQSGGRVPGGFGGGDRIPMLLEPGETIVPKALSPTFEQFIRDDRGIGGGSQGVSVMIGLDENASRVLTVKQREDSKLGIQS